MFWYEHISLSLVQLGLWQGSCSSIILLCWHFLGCSVKSVHHFVQVTWMDLKETLCGSSFMNDDCHLSFASVTFSLLTCLMSRVRTQCARMIFPECEKYTEKHTKFSPCCGLVVNARTENCNDIDVLSNGTYGATRNWSRDYRTWTWRPWFSLKIKFYDI